jgi:ribosomal-protein-alanine N-acetyltransferase
MSPPLTLLQTERLLLRPFREDDLDELSALNADAEVTRFLTGGRPRSREETAGKLRQGLEDWRLHGFGMFTLIDKADGRFVGLCGIGHPHALADAELSYSLAKRCWGRGLATEAAAAVLRYGFEVVGLPRVVCVAVAENVASQRVMAKAGMTLQGPYEFDGLQAVLYAMQNPAGDSPAAPVRRQDAVRDA